MNADEEQQRLQEEREALHLLLQGKEERLQQVQQSNESLREGLKEAIKALGSQQERIGMLEELIASQQERIKTLQGQLAKDSHNSSLPPSSDGFKRVPRSLRQKSGKKPGGQKGHRGHHLQQVEHADEVLLHVVDHCEHCQCDLREQAGRMVERRQVLELPVKRLWVSEHRVEEKACPVCFHLTRASFPKEVTAPAQYGSSIRALLWRPIWFLDRRWPMSGLVNCCARCSASRSRSAALPALSKAVTSIWLKWKAA